MRRSQAAEDFRVRQGLAGRFQSGAGELQVVVAVGEVEVGVFEKGGRGQNDVGEIGGIGLELFEDDGEQIVAPRPRRTAC